MVTDGFLYLVAQITTAIFRLIIYSIIAVLFSIFLDGDKSEIFWSTLGFLIAATILIWFIDTTIQLIIYKFNKKRTVAETHKSLKNELFVKLNSGADPDEWVEANLEIFTTDYLPDLISDKSISNEMFIESFVTPYAKLVYLAALRNGLKSTNFLTWILHTRTLRHALKKKDFKIGED